MAFQKLMLNDAVVPRKIEVSVQWIVSTLIFHIWPLAEQLSFHMVTAPEWCSRITEQLLSRGFVPRSSGRLVKLQSRR
jgi:hypothetical protein